MASLLRLRRHLPQLLLLMAPLGLLQAPLWAQSQQYILGPGSNIGPHTELKPINCVTAADGSITCDTSIQNPASDTPARPEFEPFNN